MSEHISPSFLEDIRYRILGLQFFSFSSFNILFQCLLVCIVSSEKSDVILCVQNLFFSLVAFKFFCLPHVLNCFIMMFLMVVFLPVACNMGFIELLGSVNLSEKAIMKFGNSFAFFSDMFSLSPSFMNFS